MADIDTGFGFVRPVPWGMRMFLAAAGLFCIAMPAYDFWPVLRQPSAFTPLFGIIVLGAWVVGGGLILAAVHGTHQQWKFQGSALTVDLKSLFRTWRIVVRGADVSATAVREHEMDGPNVFSVELFLKDGTKLETNGLETAAAAEALRQRILHHFELS